MALTQISTAGVKDDAVTSGKIPANAVGSSELADNAVDTAAIAANAVTASRIADSSVQEAKINNGAVTVHKIGPGSVNSSKIADATIGLDKLVHGTSANDGKFLRANNGADPTFETVTSTTINSNADNRVITGSGTANTLNAESSLTYDSGGSLKIGDNSFSNLNTGADDFVIGTESSGSNRGMSIITHSANTGHLFFGDQDNGTMGGFRYQNGADVLEGYSGGSSAFKLKSNALGIHESYPEAHSITIRGANQNDIPSLVIRKHTDGDTNHDEEIGRIKFKSNDNNVDSGNSVSRIELRAVHVNAAGAAKLEFYTVPNFTTNPVKTMTLNQDGRLCIGTDDAVARLNVVATSSSTDATSAATLANCISVSNTNTTNNNFAGIVMGDRTDSQDFVGGMLTQITNHTSNYGNIVFYTNGSGGRTEKLRIRQDGGITFNGDTATANTLDDYEEGVYSPSLYRTSSNVTYARNKGRYIRIGNMCFVWFDIQTISNNSSGSGAWRVSLPFTFANNSSGSAGLDNAGHGAPSFRDMSFMTRDQGYKTSSYINGNYIELRHINNSGSETNMIENGSAGRVTGEAWGYLSQAS